MLKGEREKTNFSFSCSEKNTFCINECVSFLFLTVEILVRSEWKEKENEQLEDITKLECFCLDSFF